MSRRRFLGLVGGAAGAAAGGTIAWSRLVDDQVRERTASPRGGAGRILVVIECSGGNDGLNTLVPANGLYRDSRPRLAVPEADLVPLSGEPGFALHPALAPLAPVWVAGQLAAIEGIGLEGQTRSHFAATDIWRAADAPPGATSWLGRWLDATAGDQADPLRAIALGTNTRVLAAERSVSTVVTAPGSFQLLAPPGRATDADAVVAAFAATAAPLSDDPLFAAAQTAIPTTLQAVDLLAEPLHGGGDDQRSADLPAGSGNATAFLESAARIIDLDIGAQILVVGIDGFDTHAGQLDRHPQLLADLGTGIARFLTAMERQGRADDVLVITTSEFGRRVAENGSGGTDHGYANVQFLAGAPLRGRQIVGTPGLGRLVEGDLPVEIDTRSLYAVALDWLGGPTDDILAAHYDRYNLV